jgi:catechol 2,3-dioxygenase-like lactoylglutathione lyase family enzyme
VPAESFTPVLPVDDLAAAVRFWSDVLGIEPTFVDGDRWAQFDLGPRRLALAGSDRATDSTALMVKVSDLEAARELMTRHGGDAGEIETGPHERRFLGRASSGEVIFYSPKPRG